jgi:hypothetical protein
MRKTKTGSKLSTTSTSAIMPKGMRLWNTAVLFPA